MTGAATWDIVTTWGVSPTFAMGLDEALLDAAGSRPTLRLYTWDPDALSLGYFQAFEDVPAAAEHPHVVRRVTGGGAIHHDAGELTFSIAIDADDPAYRGPVPRSYERTHGAIMAALASLGVEGARMRGDASCASDLSGTGMCFHDSTDLDICWPGESGALAKGVGTAQRRKGGRILHHGSIKLANSHLEERIATLSGVGVEADAREVGAALVRALETAFDVSIGPSEPSAELRAAGERLGARYADPAFVHRAVRARPRASSPPRPGSPS